jgi:hypothetical protein
MYALVTPMFSSGTISCTKRIFDNAIIPFAPDNTDYAEFKKAVAEGAKLQDADGNVMSPEAAQAFVATLP